MSRLTWTGMAALAVAACVLPGCASSGLASDGANLPVGGFVEVNLELEAGDTVQWKWRASQDMHFDIHTHAGSGVTQLVIKEGRSDESSFAAPTPGGYSLMWTNIGAAMGYLEYAVDGAGRLQSTHSSH